MVQLTPNRGILQFEVFSFHFNRYPVDVGWVVKVPTDPLQSLEAHVFIVSSPKPVVCSFGDFLRSIDANAVPVNAV